MPAGGYRPNSGRKKIVPKLNAQQVCQKALISKFGSLHKGILHLINSGEPSLLKFVYEHAIGKAVDLNAMVTPDGKSLRPTFIINPIAAPVPIDTDRSEIVDLQEGEVMILTETAND